MSYCWGGHERIDELLTYQSLSIEYEIIKRLYGILMLQIVVSTLYPKVLYDDITNPTLLGVFKGLACMILALRAAYFQQRELFLFPEGYVGRLFSLVIPTLFIVGNYLVFAKDIGNNWLFVGTVVAGLYFLKSFSIQWSLKKKGRRYFMEERLEKDTDAYKAIRTWSSVVFP